MWTDYYRIHYWAEGFGIIQISTLVRYFGSKSCFEPWDSSNKVPFHSEFPLKSSPIYSLREFQNQAPCLVIYQCQKLIVHNLLPTFISYKRSN